MSTRLTVYDLGEIGASNAAPIVSAQPAAGSSRRPSTDAAAAGATPPGPGSDGPTSGDNPSQRTRILQRRRRASQSVPVVTRGDSFRDEQGRAGTDEVQAPRRVGWRLSGSLSLLLPGTGQIVLGRPTLGLFYVAQLGLMVALGWAVLETLERTAPLLTLFGYPVAVAFWLIGAAYVVAGLLYLSNVLTATEGAEDHPAASASPVLSGAASLIVPGWGQILNGTRVRAAIYLTALLCLVALGATIHPWSRALLDLHGLYLPYWPAVDHAPTLRWTIPLLVWALAVYDAAATAAQRRQARAA